MYCGILLLTAQPGRWDLLALLFYIGDIRAVPVVHISLSSAHLCSKKNKYLKMYQWNEKYKNKYWSCLNGLKE